MHNQTRIQKASRWMRWALAIFFYSTPLTTALVWIFINRFPDPIPKLILPYYTRLPLPVQARLLGFLVMMISGAVAMYGAYTLMRLFRLYEQGRIFHSANVRCFRRLSHILIAWAVAGVVSRALMGPALTLHYPPGERHLVLSFGSLDLNALLVGGILAVIAWVMEEGRKLRAEQDYTV